MFLRAKWAQLSRKSVPKMDTKMFGFTIPALITWHNVHCWMWYTVFTYVECDYTVFTYVECDIFTYHELTFIIRLISLFHYIVVKINKLLIHNFNNINTLNQRKEPGFWTRDQMLCFRSDHLNCNLLESFQSKDPVSEYFRAVCLKQP